MFKHMLKLGVAAMVAAGLGFAAGAEAAVKVAFVTNEAGLGDRSFNDMMHEGMKRAEKELGIEFSIVQPRTISDFQSTLSRTAATNGFDIIIGSSFDMIEPMKAAAAAFPDQKFGLIDVGPDPIAPNVISSVTKDWEGSFLVGVIAAKATKTGTIGFVGGKDIPIIHRFYIGYYFGAKMANPDVNVLESYSGTFTDPAAGKEYTLALVNQKSDINFAVAGATSSGVIDAAKETNTFAIGVDSNQNYLAPGHVITSMVKRVDTEVFDMIKAVVDGTFQGGTVKYYGMAEGGVDAAMDEYNAGLIPDDVLKQVEELRQKVISGEIVVPNYFDLTPGQKEMGTPPMATPPSIANAS